MWSGEEESRKRDGEERRAYDGDVVDAASAIEEHASAVHMIAYSDQFEIESSRVAARRGAELSMYCTMYSRSASVRAVHERYAPCAAMWSGVSPFCEHRRGARAVNQNQNQKKSKALERKSRVLLLLLPESALSRGEE